MGEEICAGFVLIVLYLCMLTVTSAHPGEFLSIHCGAKLPYTDELGIKWVLDDEYVKTGENWETQVSDHNESSIQLNSFRYFPNSRTKNCYVLPVDPSSTYLLRVRLFPGKGSSQTTSPLTLPMDFSVTVNSNEWFSYSALNESDRAPILYESVFFSFERSVAYLCLLQGRNRPFINSIELRGLPPKSYWDFSTRRRRIMVLGERINTGTAPEDKTIIRYPDDEYDRFWWPTSTRKFPDYKRFEGSWKNLSFTRYPDNASYSYYDEFYNNYTPNKTIIIAWVGRNLTFGITKERPGLQKIEVTVYTKDLEPGVNITKDNPAGPLFGFPGAEQLQAQNLTDTVDFFWQDALYFDYDNISYTVASAPWFKRDVFLNAFEWYYSYDINLNATFSEDIITLNTLRESFDLQDWTGDPCYPVAWNWLTCDPNTTRVQTLMLSNMNISGTIPENISSLAGLTEMHLGNNSIHGSIPPSMVSLTNLRILALDNNKLTGDIPLAFQNKAGFTFNGNPGLCIPQGSRCNSISAAPSQQE
ncbi:hypothetical protein R1flu_003331 [Riccia fluitans]|uniref:Malectin-like domain-containing protein n=1 Tax=Riccia fluitans TaxID=41844 RepID=A0ABD1Y8S0_9MARC